jgi:8-oxo-dGTP pyrophosphatase MutT (NUDIX family)
VAKAATHAGGIVFRRDPDTVRFLLITAKNQDREWVLPKGHIEEGESAPETAVREVLEESGVKARVVEPIAPLGRLEFDGRRGWIRADFFLMEFSGEGPASTEGRSRAWLTHAEADRALGFPDARQLLAKARQAVEAL